MTTALPSRWNPAAIDAWKPKFYKITDAVRAAEKPRWRMNLTIYTPSHSIRAKALARWNERFDHVQVLWAGKKDRFTLQITPHDNLPVSSVHGRLHLFAGCI